MRRRIYRVVIAALILLAIWWLFIAPEKWLVFGAHRVITGTASWYNDGPGLYAAAGPALRHGDWRGSEVRVCNGSACVTVTLSDWCQCYGTRLVDLSHEAFARLAPLSRGLVEVRVLGVVGLPATSTMSPSLPRWRAIAE